MMLRDRVGGLAPILALLSTAGSLAACGQTDRIVPSSIPLEDYRARHAIALAEARTSIDIFPQSIGGRIDLRTAKQVYAFAQDYRTVGHGPILVIVPRGRAAENGGVGADIRRLVAAAGVRAPVEVTSYPVANPHLASPVRLSFRGIKAEVVDQCGQWPSDLSGSSSIEGWQNKPYWNFGCATQSMIAAQTSDPRDLVTPRGEEAADTLMRERGIVDIRKGTDPNTAWTVKNSNIGGIGSGN